MNNLSIYLAGAMSNCKSFEDMNTWRVEIKSMLTHMASHYDCDVKVVNPVDYYNFNEKRHKSEKEVMNVLIFEEIFL